MPKKIVEKHCGVLFLQDNDPIYKSMIALQKNHEIGFELVGPPP